MKTDGEKKLFPYFLFEISLVALFTLEAVLLLSVLSPSHLGREIDFSAPYQPRPEWYFLFLYQLTKYFPGRLTFIGAVFLPALAFGILLLAPFLDKGSSVELSNRKGAVLIALGLLAAVIVLTIVALL